MSYDYLMILEMSHPDKEVVAKMVKDDPYDLFQSRPMCTTLFDEGSVQIDDRGWVVMTETYANVVPIRDMQIRCKLAQSEGWSFVLSRQDEDEMQNEAFGLPHKRDAEINGVDMVLHFPPNEENRKRQQEYHKQHSDKTVCMQVEVISHGCSPETIDDLKQKLVKVLMDNGMSGYVHSAEEINPAVTNS